MKFEVVLETVGNQYTVIDESPDYDQAEFMWTEGNYACDCNKSIFINDQHDKSFPIMDCGDTIKLISLTPQP